MVAAAVVAVAVAAVLEAIVKSCLVRFEQGVFIIVAPFIVVRAATIDPYEANILCVKLMLHRNQTSVDPKLGPFSGQTVSYCRAHPLFLWLLQFY